MRVSLYVPFVLLCALLMSACASEQEQAQEAQQEQQRLELDQKLQTEYASAEIAGAVVFLSGSTDVKVQCPDTVDKIVRLGCEATSEDPVKRLKIKVRRPGEGDQTTSEYLVVNKLLDKSDFERFLADFLRASEPTRLLTDIECPELVERKKGVRFVCKGAGIFEDIRYGPYTVRVRAGFSRDGADPKVSRIQHVPALSP